MRKTLLLIAAAITFAACNKTEIENISAPEEIGFNTLAQNETKAYVTGTSFEDFDNPDPSYTGYVHNSWRQMRVSAFNATDSRDYFRDCTFARDYTSAAEPKPWRGWSVEDNNFAPVYWPIGKDLQFLAFSESANKQCPELNPMWDSAKKVTFNIKADQNQNDILYAQASGNNRGTAAGNNGSSSMAGLPIVFYHSQAWLTFNIEVVGDATPEVLAVNSIVLKNIYNTGVLSFEYVNGASKPKAEWDFFTQNPSDVEVADPWHVLPVIKTDAGFQNQLNMLVPEQKHDKFVLNYTLNEVAGSVELPFTGSFATADNGEWKMGYHYTYNVKIALNEITFAPKVTLWTEVEGFDPNPQSI